MKESKTAVKSAPKKAVTSKATAPKKDQKPATKPKADPKKKKSIFEEAVEDQQVEVISTDVTAPDLAEPTDIVELEMAPIPAIPDPLPRVLQSGTTGINPSGINAKNGFNQEDLRNDNIYVKSNIVSLEELTGLKTGSKCGKAIVSEGKIVSVVSNNYGYMPNDKFFYEVEANLIESDLNYITRSINRDNSHFAVDYILKDERFHIDVKGGNKGDDLITPMLRFTNSFAGGPTSGSIGFFRKVCSNGLHVAQSKIGFKIRHKSNLNEVVFPEIKGVVEKFMDNEFYQLKRKFEVLAETPIKDLAGFVKHTCTELDLFNFEISEKNPEPSANARFVMDLINTEANKVSAHEINMWLGYNAFNQIIHDKMKKSFTEQKNLDAKLFEALTSFSN